MMSRNQPRPTAAEKERIDRMMALGCVLTWLKYGERRSAECHHITVGRKRLGHWYSIPLTPWYHRGEVFPGATRGGMRAMYGASLADGSKAFVASHGYTELELWLRIQHALGLSDELPKSKVLPRRAA